MNLYTPHIDELYVGLECFIKVGDNEWDQHILSEVNENINVAYHKIKYLDAEDIIDEGFDLIAETPEDKIFKSIIYEAGDPSVIQVELSKNDAVPVLTVYKGKDLVLDKFIVKNKGEFKWILNRML